MPDVVLLDFDGTLAMRPGLWTGCVMEVLGELEPDHAIEESVVRAGLRAGFPWHRADEPHPQLCQSEAWWAPVQELIARAVLAGGLPEQRARAVAAAARERFADPSRGWQLFDDVIPALDRLAAAGWSAIVLSNHIPELEGIVAGLGLSERIEMVFSSALTGYEKPHPNAFRMALRSAGAPRAVWMIGDNPIADVRGAEAVGIPAILVRTQASVKRRVEGLEQAASLILGG